MTEIKRCPFCGGNAKTEVWVRQKGGPTDDVDFAVACTECGTHKTVVLKIDKSCLFYDVEKAMAQAIEAWNRRAGDE